MKNTDKFSDNSSQFENKISELQKIVAQLEGDSSVTLEDSMSLFEKGLALTKECVDDLTAMQSRIIELNKKLDIILNDCGFGDGDDR